MVFRLLLVPAALLLQQLPVAQSFAFSPDDPADFLWDTWIRRRPEGGWLLNYLVKHHTPRWEAWNAISSASSAPAGNAPSSPRSWRSTTTTRTPPLPQGARTAHGVPLPA